MNLNDLPDEVLCKIFDKLDLHELKPASLVCRRWSELSFSGQRMDRVWLVQHDAGWELVLNTRRSYRNIRQRPFSEDDGRFESLARLLRTLKFPVRMLDMRCSITSQQLLCILLEVPELQHFSIEGYIDFKCNTNGPIPVLTKLKCLKLHQMKKNQLDFHAMNVLNLQSLYMSCETDRELKAWRYVSGQLKLVHIYLFNASYFCHFLELTFPHLEDFTIEDVAGVTVEKIASSNGHDFFRRHSLLRRLSFDVTFPVEWIRSITSHCPKLTYLDLRLEDPEEGILESLVHCPLLKHLILHGKLDTKLFRGAIKSLESVKLRMHPSRVFLENLFETAPQLHCLEINPIYYDFLQALDCKFICEKFSCLRRLELDLTYQIPADNSVRIDRLVHLEELKICNAKNIRNIHRNNVRCLTLSFYLIRNKDLDQIAEKFPLLNRLTFKFCPWLSEPGIKRLQKLIPSSRIDFDSQRFYPQVHPLARRSARIKARNS